MPARRQQGRRKRSLKARRRARSSRPAPMLEEAGEPVELLEERALHPETGPSLSGGDVDADWQRAQSTGEEAVGGSVATPDQDVVDEIGRALGVEQEPDAEVRASEEILEERRRRYWQMEREAAEREEE